MKKFLPPILLLGWLGCGDETPSAADAGSPDSGTEDAGATPSGPYGYRAPPASAPPDGLAPGYWRTHWVNDIRPYWMHDDALGEPAGNYPTYRTRVGDAASPNRRRPRMIARQIYAYSMGYLLTGEAALLERAGAGVRWLLDHAVDPRGGCHEQLDADGGAIDGPKYAQDTAYCALGLGAWYFVTRDEEAEAALLGLRDLLFSEGFWDAEAERIRDGMNAELSAEVDQSNDGGWELVAQLDPINAFLLLTQPALHDASRRDEFLGDMLRLVDAMRTHFWQDGIYWGVHDQKGRYGRRHVDFGHTLKAYWMTLEVDKRVEGHPNAAFLAEHVPAWIERAFDGERWKKRPTSANGDEGGSDWWIYAEAEQIAATWNMGHPGTLTSTLSKASGHWVEDFVDGAYLGEVISGIEADGSPVWNWSPSDTFKCNEWKNGYHSTEHALVMYLHGSWLASSPAELYFAVPADEVESFVATPYIYHGTEMDRTADAPLEALGLTPVRVRFESLW